MTKAQILLVDDERLMRRTFSATLRAAGYDVREAKDGAEAVAACRAARPDLVLLDVMMPKTNGLDACRRIRETDAETPILFLTALDSEAAQVKGLGVGADDYISKTASSEVLLARVAAALRRRNADAPTGDFDIGAWRVHARQMAMTRASGERVALSDREIALLRYFAGHVGEAVSRDFLLTQFWGAETRAQENTLSVYLHALREKLGDDGARLKSVRGVGYAYVSR